MTKKNNFDGLRLVGALLVLCSHQFALQGHSEPHLYAANLGQCGLAMFFGISGYLVTDSWFRDPNIFRFTVRRFLRVWPALAVVVVILWACCMWLPWIGIDRLRYSLAGQLFLRTLSLFDRWDWGGFFANNPYGALDIPLWTIPLEVRCYAILGLSLFLLEKRARWLILPAMLLAAFRVSDWFAILGCCFLSGSAMWLFRWGWTLAVVAIVLGLLRGHSLYIVLVAIAPLAVIVGRSSWPVFRDGARFGDLSYGTYVWAWPVAQVGIVLFGMRPWLIVWTLSATGTIAWLSWHLIESQALKLKPSKSGACARWWRGAAAREEADGVVGPA